MIVMDCSAAVEIARGTEKGKGLALLIEPQEEVIAPSWFRAEVRNVFWKYVHAGMLDESDAAKHVRIAETLVTDYVGIEGYLSEAFAQAVRHDHPFYDMLYLCMARRNAAMLFTVDKELANICDEAKVGCVREVDW